MHQTADYQLLYNNMRVNKRSNETTGKNTATTGACEIGRKEMSGRNI
jgi:hypothetical protein